MMQTAKIATLNLQPLGMASLKPGEAEAFVSKKADMSKPTAEPAVPAEPVYTQKDMEVAENTGYAKGYTEGVQAGIEQSRNDADTRDKALLDALKKISAEVDAASQLCQKFIAAQSRHINTIAIAVSQKMVANALEVTPEAEVERIVRECLNLLVTAPKVTLHINPALESVVEKKLHGINLGGQVSIKINESVALGDCKLEWQNGAAERNSKELWQDIEQIISKIKVPVIEPGNTNS